MEVKINLDKLVAETKKTFERNNISIFEEPGDNTYLEYSKLIMDIIKTDENIEEHLSFIVYTNIMNIVNDSNPEN